MSFECLSLESVGKQLHIDANGLINVIASDCSQQLIGKDPAWVYPATFDNSIDLDVIIIPRLKGFAFSIKVKGRKNSMNPVVCSRETEYTVEKFRQVIHNMLGKPAGPSSTRYAANFLTTDAAKYAKNRNGLELHIRTTLTNALEQDFGHGPKVINSWVMDGVKDDYADFIFVVKGLRNQLPDFDIQLQLAFSPESSSWSVYSQYIRNDDDRIFVDTDDISPETPDPLSNLRAYLETVVETGNKKYSQFMKKRESDE